MAKYLFITIVCCSAFILNMQAEEDLTKYVSPIVGSDSEFALSGGNLYPCIARPWGMNHWTPQTGNNDDRWQYTYDAKHIVGLKQTHQPSPWVGDYGVFSLMATVGDKVFREEDRKSWFTHKTEIVQPHYYKVYLAEYDVHAEMTPSARGSIIRFVFPEGDKSNIVIDAFAENSYIKIIPEENKIVGYSRQSIGYEERKPENFKNYFVIIFDKPIKSFSLWEDDKFVEGSETSSDAVRTGAVLTFGTKAKEAVEARVASSFISHDQAAKNLQQEIGRKTFEELMAEGKEEWNSHLNRFKVKANLADGIDNLRMFYTCLYRILLYPREFHEYDSTGNIVHYSPYNGQVLPGRMYTDNGFWDTFRAVHPFFNLFYPELSRNIMEGLANTYKESGWLPEWASPGHLGDSMIGSNSSSLIASAYMNGVTEFDTETLWQAMVKNSNNSHPVFMSVGRAGAEYYNKIGYVPNDIGIKESAARTLEYAYADFCLMKMAEALGKDKDTIRLYKERAFNYKNLFHKKEGWMAGKNRKGEFRPDFNRFTWGGDFTEGCSMHYTWSVLHDPIGLTGLMGGPEGFINNLDTMFTTPPIFDESAYGGIIHEMREMQVMDFGQYAHGNQPVQHMIYLYNWTKEPWKAQYWAREVMKRMYRPTPDGYCGDEDNGQTSAWYVFSALGFYPVCPVTGEYAIGSPLFPEIEIQMPDGNYLTISAENNSAENVYIDSIVVNENLYTKNYFTTKMLQSGGAIEIKMSKDPNKKRGIHVSDMPYSMSATY